MKNEGRRKRKPRNILVGTFIFLFFICQIYYGGKSTSGDSSSKNRRNNNGSKVGVVKSGKRHLASNIENGEFNNSRNNSLNNSEKKTNINENSNSKAPEKKNGENHVTGQYKSIIFDAGSTGTRVHIYSYNIVGEKSDEENQQHKYEDIKIFIPSINFKMTPGLVYLLNNYFEGDTEQFDLYFKKIKSFLNEHIEEKEKPSTAILFRASGGFRLLSINISNKYISFLKKYFHEHFSEYLLIDDVFVKVLSGKEEAILSFVSINTLLKNFSHNPLVFPREEDGEEQHRSAEEAEKTDTDIQTNGKEQTYTNNVSHKDKEPERIGESTAVVEIGGASAQIVVQLPLSKINEDVSNHFNYKSSKDDNNAFIKENYKKRNIVKINLFHKDIFLYCKSYLVLGRQNVMKTYLHYLVHMNNKKKGTVKKFIPVSCFPRNFKFHIDTLFKTSIEEDLYEYNKNKILNKNEYIGVGTGNIHQCRKEMQIVLHHSKIDNLPFKLKKFIKVYAIENFHHFVTDILNIPDDYNPLLIDTDMYLKKAEELCPSTVEEIIKVISPSANLEKAQTSCFGLIFLYEFLRHLFQIENSIQIYSSNYVNNISITWTIAVLLMEIPAYFDIIKKRKAQQEYANYYQDEL